MDIDKQIISRLFTEIALYRKLLGDYTKIDQASFLSSAEKPIVVRYALQTMVQSAIDIGLHILSRLGRNSIETYADVFIALGKEGILSETLVQEFIKLSGLRNIIVHRYGQVDDKKLFEFLKSNLSDFDDFRIQVEKFLDVPK